MLDQPSNAGWFRAVRSPEATELLQANPRALLLAYVIASRAQWSTRFNRHGLEQGQAFLGDHDSMGMSEKEYRTAKKHLEQWGFAAFKGTNKGTVAWLTDSRLFEVVLETKGGQKGDQEADGGRSRGEPRATTEEQKNMKKEEKFRPPTLDEVLTQADRVGLPEEKARKFFAHYEGNEWTTSRGSMKQARDWIFALTKWSNDHQSQASKAEPLVLPLPMARATSLVPTFEPLRTPIYKSDAVEMKKVCDEKIREIERAKENRARRIKKDVADLVANLERTKPPGWESRVADLKQRDASWIEELKPEAAAAVSAWKRRKSKIDDALVGATAAA